MAQEAAHTLDAFHRGRFWLVQPRQTGHRAGADALILAAAVPSAFSGRLADFGAGAGGRSYPWILFLFSLRKKDLIRMESCH